MAERKKPLFAIGAETEYSCWWSSVAFAQLDSRPRQCYVRNSSSPSSLQSSARRLANRSAPTPAASVGTSDTGALATPLPSGWTDRPCLLSGTSEHFLGGQGEGGCHVGSGLGWARRDGRFASAAGWDESQPAGGCPRGRQGVATACRAAADGVLPWGSPTRLAAPLCASEAHSNDPNRRVQSVSYD